MDEFCRDVNVLSAWLAMDDPCAEIPAEAAVVWFGNQVVATITAACELAVRKGSMLLASGGIGHSTAMLYENLRESDYGALVRDGSVLREMAEAEMCAAIATGAFSLPAERVLVEARSRNGGENARFSQSVIEERGLAERSIVLVQDPIMQRRSVVTWHSATRRAGRRKAGVASHPAFVPLVEPGPDGLPCLIVSQRRGTWSIGRFIGLMLGEMERLYDGENGYGPRGKSYFDHVEIPERVWESYLRVRGSG